MRGLPSPRHRRARRLARACSPRSSASRRRNSSIGSRSNASTGTRSMSACIAIGSIRPGRSPSMVAKPAHGVLVTSATLTDGSGDAVKDWEAAEARTGARHLAAPAYARARALALRLSRRRRASSSSTTCSANDLAQVAGAYRALFLASGGGALGLFTAIARLRDGASAHRRAARGSGAAASGAACRRHGYRDAGRYFPRRGGCLPARHRCGARRRRRAGPLAAPHRVRPRAVAAARHSAQGAAAARFGGSALATTSLTRLAAAPGVRPPGPPRRR